MVGLQIWVITLLDQQFQLQHKIVVPKDRKNTMSISDIFNGKTWEKVKDTKSWETLFMRTPCVKSSYLWGLGCGSVVMAHKLRIYRGNVRHAVSSGILTFIIVSTVSFVTCANEVNRKYDQLQKAFRIQGIKEDPNKSPQSRYSGSDSPPAEGDL